MSEIKPNARLSRKNTAEALTEHGFPTTEATLATLASRGGGPVFQKWGQRCVYRWGDAIAWAEGRLSNPISSTSQLRLSSVSVPR
jgi:hypothetical protein